MSATVAGGIHAANTNKQRHGEDFYSRIGRLGGLKGTTGGFAANPQLAREAGRKGGLKSRRGKIYKYEVYRVYPSGREEATRKKFKDHESAAFYCDQLNNVPYMDLDFIIKEI